MSVVLRSQVPDMPGAASRVLYQKAADSRSSAHLVKFRPAFLAIALNRERAIGSLRLCPKRNACKAFRILVFFILQG